MSRKFLIFVLSLALIVIFLIFSPKVDQYLAILPFDSSSYLFYGEESDTCQFIYNLVHYITVFLIIIPIITLILSAYIKPYSKYLTYFSCVTLVALGLGPGLVVNFIFKDHWGRPRPYQVIRDGATYAPIWKPDFNQPLNNSLPSGHAAIGFFIGVPVIALGYRRLGIGLGIIGGAIVGLVRILQGGHYLSDVLLSGLCILLVSVLTFYLINKIVYSNAQSLK